MADITAPLPDCSTHMYCQMSYERRWQKFHWRVTQQGVQMLALIQESTAWSRGTLEQPSGLAVRHGRPMITVIVLAALSPT